MSLIGSVLSAASLAANAILGDELAPYALFSVRGRVIGTIAVDVPLREVHNDSYSVSQDPIESRSSSSDNYFRNPKQYETTVGYSDSTAGYDGYVQDVYNSFIALAETGEPFSVSSGKRQLDNMMFVDISVITDPTSEYVLYLTARFQEAIITTTENGSGMTQANQANPSETAPTVNAGNQALQPAPTSGLTPSGFVAGPN